MRRYWIDPKNFEDSKVLLKGDDFHHICHVCRRGEGDRFEVIANGQAFLVEIESLFSKQAVAQVIEQRPLPEAKPPFVHLALSLPKFQTVDKVVEKMVELGVHKVHLFSSDFSFMKPKPGELNNKYKRWGKIIQGATQQTGRGDQMQLTEVRPLGVLLQEDFSSQSGACGLLAYEGEGGESIGSRVGQLPPDLQNVWIFVGAEGGFSPQDLELFNNYKLLPVSLGDQVLRVETACVTLVSILKYALKQYD